MVGGLSLFGTRVGPAWTFAGIAVLYVAAWCAITQVRPRPPRRAAVQEPIWESVVAGAKYVWNDQVLLGSMALDLFAVLFGGAIALLPVFAKDILHVGPEELGLLAAAPTTGALLTMVWSARSPPVKHAGRNFMFVRRRVRRGDDRLRAVEVVLPVDRDAVS